MATLNILLASSEVYPFAKTGGLADVCGSLPLELRRLGQEIAVIMPAFRQCFTCGQPIEELPIYFDLPIGSKVVSGQLLKSYLPDSDIPVYLVKNNEYYDRPQLYREDGEDYQDNCERFVFFSRAILEAIRLLNLPVDLIHCNDWQTGLAPAYLDIEYAATPGYEKIATLLTIHNMAYQGNFWHWDMVLTGLDWKYFNMHQMEFYGHLNFLKTGIVFADSISTVSPRYGQEIQSSPLGCGLEGVLRDRSSVLSGVVNGVDYDKWNPATDDAIAVKFGVDDWEMGKPACKKALQQEFNLPTDPQAPIIGMVGRMADQKGFDLVAEVIQEWARTRNTQWVILGTGEPGHQNQLSQLAQQYPDKVGVKVEFCEAKARRVEAGADMFLMPSLYEPCGLNQLYSLKYGAVPVVRETGGLADTITDTDDDTLAEGTANGFSFREYSSHALADTLHRACRLYQNDKETWKRIVNNGMAQDWSWKRSAGEYVRLFEDTVARKQSRVNGNKKKS
ncbi:glycogen synthase GlgA [Blastopirellula marina]|uniref:Glycogen synthase n=1 Tax=Blastopirellula marina TaxID=124 RepID=A0A2S8GG23_9BACT|nr:glycogen synthase GlgA [Blastopirellula marina]PQO43230.1 glycogen synthase GlgA [Blastopirellula marina]PTL42617.1 glycogen synthase GlgA [Blastopirellula marina]